MRTIGSVRSARREPSMGTARSRAARGILVLALVVGGLGAAALAQGHGGGGHIRASGYQSADSLVFPAGADVIGSAVIGRGLPWIF